MSLTNAVTNQQIDSLLQALDHEPVMDCDYAVVRRWLEMINSAAEPGEKPSGLLGTNCSYGNPYCPQCPPVSTAGDA